MIDVNAQDRELRQECERAYCESWKQQHKHRPFPRSVIGWVIEISKEYDKAVIDKMNLEQELRAKFLSSEERRQLKEIRNYKLKKNLFRLTEENSLVVSDYAFLQEGDVLSRLEEKVSKNGWIF